MFLLTLFTSFVVAAAKVQEIPCATCVRLDDLCHNVTFVVDFDAPFRDTIVITKLGILRSKNTLLYAFEPAIPDPEYYKIGYVNLDNFEITGILEGSKKVVNFQTFAFDQEKNTIYIGGGDAIYILENNAPKGVFYSSGGDTILSMFFRKNLFFVRYGENKIVELQGELFKPYEEYTNVKDFVIDRNNVLVYLNISGLYANKFHTNETVQLSKNPFFRGLTVDLDSIVYAWHIDGIYRVTIKPDIHDSTIQRVAKIPSIGALTFDNDNNLLFTSSRGLYVLSPTNNVTVC